MKITDVRVHVVSPMGTDEVIPGSRLGWAFVEVDTDEGLTGIGECSNWTGKGDILIGHAVRTLKDSLVGRDPSRIERIWRDVFGRYTYLGNRGLVTTVISGIDQALWDIKGKMLGRPVHDLLGGAVRDDVLLYSHPWGTTTEDVVASCRTLLTEGYDAVKLDPFMEMLPRLNNYQGGQISATGIREGAEMIGAIRDAVGPDVEILIDAHGNFNVATALRCIRAVEPYGITWFEEPVPPEGLNALRQVRAQTDMDLCVGERLFTRWDFLPILSDNLANYLMPDICWTGGISELKKIATMAETYFVPVSPHGAQGPVQIVAGGHVMMTTPNFYRLEINSVWLDLFNSAVEPSLDIRDGRLHVGSRPGLGIELNHDFLESHPDPDWTPSRHP